jgi:hypothetical protein
VRRMNVIRSSLLSILALCCCARSILCQISAQITLENSVIDVPDSPKLTAVLNVPLPCDQAVAIVFQLQDGGDQFAVYVQGKKGESTLTLTTARLPDDLKGGRYKAARGQMDPCAGSSHTLAFTVTPIEATIRAKPDDRIYPTSASLILTLNQKQILRTGAARIGELLSDAEARLAKDRANTPALRSGFAKILQEADSSLQESRDKYLAPGASKSLTNHSPAIPLNQPQGKDGDPTRVASPPIIFDDLHIRYVAAIIELKVPVSPQTSANQNAEPHLLLAQLSKRPPQKGNDNPPGLSQTLPLWVSSALFLMKDHKDAFNRLADGGLDTFTFDLDSAPDGATVSYSRAGHSFQSFSGVTPLKAKTLELALWTFRFEKAGCDSATVDVDAVAESNPHPYGDLLCSKDKRNRR